MRGRKWWLSTILKGAYVQLEIIVYVLSGETVSVPPWGLDSEGTGE